MIKSISETLVGRDEIIEYLLKQDDVTETSKKDALRGVYLLYMDKAITIAICKDVVEKYVGSDKQATLLDEILAVDVLNADNGETVPDRSSGKKHFFWTHKEDVILLAGILHFGTSNWSRISDLFKKSRNRTQCCQRWTRSLNHRISTEPWSPEDESNLQILVEKHGINNWTAIANDFGKRNDVQCRFRYTQLLNSIAPKFQRIENRKHSTYDHSEIEPILAFLTLPLIPHGAITKISRDTGIPQQTLSDWRGIRTTPGREQWFPNQDGRENRRIFSRETELSILDKLKQVYITPGIGAVRNDIKTISIEAYESESEQRYDRFTASNCFIDSFMDRHRLRLYTPRHERRTRTDLTEEENFLFRVSELKEEYPLSRIYNADETSWRLYMYPKKVLEEKGASSVKLNSSNNEKLSVTAIGAINAEGAKLPLWVLRKGKTMRCVQKHDVFDDIIMHNSENGWSTETVMVDFLKSVHVHAGGEPCCVIWDVYPSHRSELVCKTAAELFIELLYVPAGATSRFQPLDVRIFGELKMRARAAFEIYKASKGRRDIDFHDSISILRDCWSKITSENILKAWQAIPLI